MSLYSVTRTRVRDGIWEGLVTASDAKAAQPNLTITCQDKALTEVELTSDGNGAWRLRIVLPHAVVTEGVQTVLIADSDTNEPLDHLSILTGDAPSHDLRGEVELLRAELDMLKRAFRRHCLELEDRL